MTGTKWANTKLRRDPIENLITTIINDLRYLYRGAQNIKEKGRYNRREYS